MKFGICGYGNLGRAVEERILASDDKLVGIFSRRAIGQTDKGFPVYDFNDAPKFQKQIDVMLMCGGSQEDLLWQSPIMLKHFDIVDTFDTHAKISQHRENLQKVSEQSGHRAIYSCGWDPGLFSLARTLAGNIFGRDAQTFWGEGVSQGHSEALRNIDGVVDAIQFTIPRKDVLEKVDRDPTYVPDEREKHDRVCYVCIDGKRSQEEIAEEIQNTENYFKGQHVVINFCSKEQIDELKRKMSHKGVVIGGDTRSQIRFAVDMQRNPEFTAKVMLAYAHAIPKLGKGAYSVLDVPIQKIGKQDNARFL